MLQPFEVDLLRQDLRQALKLLGRDEIDDARALIKDHRFLPEDFEIVEHPDPLPAGPSALTGTVTLTRNSTGQSKTYAAGHAISWLVQFEQDLNSGVFGR